jgi:hypothetical protein
MATDEQMKQEVDRYRRAAEETLDQLDWCVDYFHRIRKPQLADALAKNRTSIRRRMRGDD